MRAKLIEGLSQVSNTLHLPATLCQRRCNFALQLDDLLCEGGHGDVQEVHCQNRRMSEVQTWPWASRNRTRRVKSWTVGAVQRQICETPHHLPFFRFSSFALLERTDFHVRFVSLEIKCGDTVLPEVVVARRLTVFLEDDMDRLFPRDRWVRALAHPTRLPVKTSGHGTSGTQANAVHAGTGGQAAQVASSDFDTTPVAGVRFSQIEPPKGEIEIAVRQLPRVPDCGIK